MAKKHKDKTCPVCGRVFTPRITSAQKYCKHPTCERKRENKHNAAIFAACLKRRKIKQESEKKDD